MRSRSSRFAEHFATTVEEIRDNFTTFVNTTVCEDEWMWGVTLKPLLKPTELHTDEATDIGQYDYLFIYIHTEHIHITKQEHNYVYCINHDEISSSKPAIEEIL